MTTTMAASRAATPAIAASGEAIWAARHPARRERSTDVALKLGDFDIYRAARNVAGSFNAPIQVPGALINTTANESAAVVTPDELTLYFASDRTGGAGLFDIYVATRAAVADNFGAPIDVAEINTAGDDRPTWISSDGCVLYLISCPTTSQPWSMYYATRGQ